MKTSNMAVTAELLAHEGEFQQIVRVTTQALQRAQLCLGSCTKTELANRFAHVFAFAQRENGIIENKAGIAFDSLLRSTREDKPIWAVVGEDDQRNTYQLALRLVDDDSWNWRISRKPPRLELPTAPLDKREIAAIKFRLLGHRHLVADNIHRFPVGVLARICQEKVPGSPLHKLLCEARTMIELRDDALDCLDILIPDALIAGHLDGAWTCAFDGVTPNMLGRLAKLPCEDPEILKSLDLAQAASSRFTELMGFEGDHEGKVCSEFRAHRQRYRFVYRALCREVYRAFQRALSALKRGETELVPTLYLADDFRPQWLLPMDFAGSHGAFVINRDPPTGMLTIPTFLTERLVEHDISFMNGTIRWAV